MRVFTESIFFLNLNSLLFPIIFSSYELNNFLVIGSSGTYGPNKRT